MKYQGQGYVALVEATLKLHVTASTFKPLYIYIYMSCCCIYVQEFSFVKWCFLSMAFGKISWKKSNRNLFIQSKKENQPKGGPPLHDLYFLKGLFPKKTRPTFQSKQGSSKGVSNNPQQKKIQGTLTFSKFFRFTLQVKWWTLKMPLRVGFFVVRNLSSPGIYPWILFISFLLQA